MPSDAELRDMLAQALRRIEVLEKALRPFAGMRLSTEGEVSDLVCRSVAEELRRRAAAVEDRDAEILAARTAIEGGKP